MQLPFFATDRVRYFPPRIWIITPLLWASFLVLVTFLAIALGLRRWLTMLLILAGPGILLAVKIAIATRFSTPGSTPVFPILLWVVVVVPLAAVGNRIGRHFMNFPPNRHLAAGAAILIASCMAIAMAEREPAIEAAHAAVASRSPNVVIVFVDTFRADAMANAPNLSRLAARARNYENAYAPYPWTLPSHLSVMTGYGPADLGIDFEHQTYLGARNTLAEIFRRRGYETAAIFANPYLNPDTGIERGFDSFVYSEADLDVCRTTFGFFIKAIPNARVPMCRMTADEITRRAATVIALHKRPLFLALNYFDAHLPHYVPARWRPQHYETFQPLVEYPIADRSLRRMERVPEEELQHLRANYAISVRYLDNAIGHLLHAIEASPDSANTIVVIVGDHGEQFGEHDLTLHANSVYRQVLQVPLIVFGPGIAAGAIAQPVSPTQLYGTLLSLTGSDVRGLMPLPDANDVARPVFSLYRAPRVKGLPLRLSMDAWSVVDAGFHLIRYSDGSEDLYDVAGDPRESIDLAERDGAVMVRARLSKLLVPLESATSRRSEHRREELLSLGYLQ